MEIWQKERAFYSIIELLTWVVGDLGLLIVFINFFFKIMFLYT